MKIQKLHLIILLILAVILLSGCNYKIIREQDTENKQKADQLTSDFLFNKKQECAKYKKDIEKKFTDDQQYSLSIKILDEIFYSPSLNSCLYSYTTYYIDTNGKLMNREVMGIDYIIEDVLTNEVVLNGNTVINNEISSIFENRKKELKN